MTDAWSSLKDYSHYIKSTWNNRTSVPEWIKLIIFLQKVLVSLISVARLYT